MNTKDIVGLQKHFEALHNVLNKEPGFSELQGVTTALEKRMWATLPERRKIYRDRAEKFTEMLANDLRLVVKKAYKQSSHYSLNKDEAQDAITTSFAVLGTKRMSFVPVVEGAIKKAQNISQEELLSVNVNLTRAEILIMEAALEKALSLSTFGVVASMEARSRLTPREQADAEQRHRFYEGASLLRNKLARIKKANYPLTA